MFLPSLTGVRRASSFVPGGGFRNSRSAFQSWRPSPRLRQSSEPGSDTTITRSPTTMGLEWPVPTVAFHFTFFVSVHSVAGVASGNSPVPLRLQPNCEGGSRSGSAGVVGFGSEVETFDAGAGSLADVDPTPDLPAWRA